MNPARGKSWNEIMSALPIDDEPTASSFARTGQVVGGRYEITGELGRGSTGIVWGARDTETGERVAVKILHDSLVPSPPVRKRFHREAASARALAHPHSVRVLGDGVTPDGADFLVMEHLDGHTLAAELDAAGALPQLRAIRIAAQVLDAAAEAHRRGIVHRDLKPGNVMLVARDDGADDVKVCDYGLAKAVEAGGEDGVAASFATIQGVLCGTPAYMSPEQARGEDLDGRTDLYAVSVMLFRMVVGRLPFEERTPVDVISAHLNATPPRPRALRPEIAPALENVILRGLAKNRRERPASAEVYRADLLQIERDLVRDQKAGVTSSWVDETVQSDGPAPRPLARKEARPRPRLGLLVALLLGAAAGAAGMLVRAPRETTVPAASVAQLPPAPPVPAEPARPPATATPAPDVVAHPAAAPKKRHTDAPRPQPEAAQPRPAATDLLRQAEEALGAGRIEDARALGLAAAESQPSLAAAWEFLGRCYMRLGRADEARTFYRRALALAPDGPNAAFLRAIVDRGERPHPR
jgi:serine/threonine-protein kinase